MTSLVARVRAFPNPDLADVAFPDAPRWSSVSVLSALLAVAAHVVMFVFDVVPVSPVLRLVAPASALLVAVPALRVAVSRFQFRRTGRLRWVGPTVFGVTAATWAATDFGVEALVAAGFVLWEEALFWLVLPALIVTLLGYVGLSQRAAWVMSVLISVLLFACQPYHLAQGSPFLVVPAAAVLGSVVSSASLLAGRWWLAAATHVTFNAVVEPFSGPLWLWVLCLFAAVVLSLAAVFKTCVPSLSDRPLDTATFTAS